MNRERWDSHGAHKIPKSHLVDSCPLQGDKMVQLVLNWYKNQPSMRVGADQSGG